MKIMAVWFFGFIAAMVAVLIVALVRGKKTGEYLDPWFYIEAGLYAAMMISFPFVGVAAGVL